MPAQLPPEALQKIPDHAVQVIGQHGRIETYATVDFVGRETNPDAVPPIVEVDENSWIEANFWHFEEVSETRDQVVLFDDSRDVTMVIDYPTNEILIYAPSGDLALIYDITGVHYSLTPVIPDDWII
jgi:hypothetical protein